jgi:hypothetical protein
MDLPERWLGTNPEGGSSSEEASSLALVSPSLR